MSSPVRTMQELIIAGVVKTEDASLFSELRGLRNQAAHFQEFNPSHIAAQEYVNMASGLESKLILLSKPNYQKA